MTYKTFPFLYRLCALASGCGDVVQSREDGHCFLDWWRKRKPLSGFWKDDGGAVKQTSHVGTS